MRDCLTVNSLEGGPIVKMSKQQKLDWTGSINIWQSSVRVRRANREFLTSIAFVFTFLFLFVFLFDFVFFFTNQHLAQNRDGLRWSRISFSHSESLSLCLYLCLYFVLVFGISLCLCRQQPIKSTFQPGEKRANGDRAESFFLHSESFYLCLFLCLCLSSSQLTSGRGKEEQIETERRVSFSHSQAAED